MMKDRIIEVLSDPDRPAKSAIEINDDLGFTNIDEYRVLEKTLEDMAREGVLYYSEKKKR